MKCDVMPGLIQLEKEELQQLCCEVKETIANDIVFPEIKVKETSFGIGDLWSIQRKMKTAGRHLSKHSALVIRGQCVLKVYEL